MTEILKQIWEFVSSHPLQILLWIVGGIFVLLYGLKLLRRFYAGWSFKNRIFFRITMPRDDSQKDKEKDVEKDFREKISIMAQFFRNLEETREMNIWNVIKTRILNSNVFTFELVAEDKNVNFYVTTPKYYADIVEKQITSYYTDAEVIQVEPYKIMPEGNKMKGFYAFEKNPFWFPIKTFKKIENDPLNDLTNVFSSMTQDETAAFQIVISPKSEKWQKKAERQGSFYFQGGQRSVIANIPVIGKIYAFLAGIIFGYEKYKEMAPQKEVESGYVRMLQTKEEVAKSIGEKAQQAGFDTIIRIIATAKTEERAEELANNMIVVPNSKLASSIIVNYYAPDKELAVLVPVSVGYGSDLQRVEKITVEVAREMQQAVQGAVKGFQPFIRYGAFADSGISLTVIMRANEYVDKYLLTHEFIKALHARYAKEGIEIPYPKRHVYLENVQKKAKRVRK